MTLEIDTGSGLMPAHEWGSRDSTAPGILLLQEIFGVSDYIQRRATDLAALGYYVIAPEIAWRRTEDFLARHLPPSQGQT
ncbi:dienelactone hydrolase family protein [Kribbella sp. NPDC055071]